MNFEQQFFNFQETYTVKRSIISEILGKKPNDEIQFSLELHFFFR